MSAQAPNSHAPSGATDDVTGRSSAEPAPSQEPGPDQDGFDGHVPGMVRVADNAWIKTDEIASIAPRQVAPGRWQTQLVFRCGNVLNLSLSDRVTTNKDAIVVARGIAAAIARDRGRG